MRNILLFFLIAVSGFAQTEETISSGNSKLYYRTFGSGLPILLINGGPGLDSNGFTSLAKQLSGDNKVIIFDQRGTGKSVLPTISKESITMDLMVSDIENLRKHLKIEKWIVIGHSFGGMLASYYATLYPDNISGIIMSCSGGIDLDLRTYVNQKIRKMLTKEQVATLDRCNRKISRGDTSAETRLERASVMAYAYVVDRKFAPAIAERLASVNLEINTIVWNDLERMKFDCAKNLKNFSAPVLVIQGNSDLLEVRTAEKIHNAFTNSTLLIIDKCGHYGWLDAPSIYFPAIEKFLKTV